MTGEPGRPPSARRPVPATRRLPRAVAAVVGILLSTSALPSPADVSLKATVDRTEIAQGEVLTLQVRLESPEPPTRLDLPATSDFQVEAQEQSQEHDFTLGGGGGVLLRQAYVITARLRPVRAGALTIPSVRAVVRGREYVTQPIVVKVGALGTSPRGAPSPGAGGPAPGPQAGSRAYRGWEKDLVLEVRLDRKEAYLGEQVTASFWLLSPLELLQCEGVKTPRYDGFWQEELETPRTRFPLEIRNVNGIPTRAYLVQRVALFPTRAGELTVDSMELSRITLRMGRPSLLGAFDDVVTLSRKSAPVLVKVRPLPPDAPPGYEPGNVGTLQLDVSISPSHVQVGEPFTVRVQVSGDGNVRALSPPRVSALPGTRTFPPVTRDATERRNNRLFGTRIIETVVVPEQPGELVLPPSGWPYFDPGVGRYQLAPTPELRVNVIPAGAATGPGTAPGTNVLTAGLRPIRSGAILSRRGPPAWQEPWFLALLVLPPLAFFSAAAADRLRRKAQGARALRGGARTARRRLRLARRHFSHGDATAAVAEVEQALSAYASNRLGHVAAGLTRDSLAEELLRAGAHPPAVRALFGALDLVDAARYGAGDLHGEELLTAAERALDALEEADWQAVEGGK